MGEGYKGPIFQIASERKSFSLGPILRRLLHALAVGISTTNPFISLVLAGSCLVDVQNVENQIEGWYFEISRV